MHNHSQNLFSDIYGGLMSFHYLLQAAAFTPNFHTEEVRRSPWPRQSRTFYASFIRTPTHGPQNHALNPDVRLTDFCPVGCTKNRIVFVDRQSSDAMGSLPQVAPAR
jgi:hypothetical protein